LRRLSNDNESKRGMVYPPRREIVLADRLAHSLPELWRTSKLFANRAPAVGIAAHWIGGNLRGQRIGKVINWAAAYALGNFSE
jgi:hypothetical protein